ncbi:putative protein kinase [Trypanosoma cruzi]|uniref:Aurora kinase n=1 Tax=Trypanosoma cruzi TaxID=5693 RepID=A0A2V2WHN3_TRYCR|nr:putative protein kinase [Trypanosoma cruzi]
MSFNLRDGSWLYEWGGSRRTGDGDCTSLRPTNRTVAGAAARDALLSCSPRFAQGRGEAVWRQMWSLDDFDIGRKLGEGRFGKIYLAREKRTKCAVVIKCLSKDMIRYHGLAHQLRREVELQEYAGRCHRHILRLFAYFWDDVRVFLVLEYADGGNLQTLLDTRTQHRVSEEEARRILRPLLSALAFLHERDIIHRDVKPDNILFKAQAVKLADFSWAVRLDRRVPQHSRRYTLCGTMDYLAPEQISRRGCTTKADVWALGILTYRMLCGNLPFEHLSAWELCARITRGNVQYPTHLSMEAQNFMESLLCVDEASRLSCEEALKHPFIVGSSCSLHEASAETELPSAVSFQCSPTPEHWDNRFVRVSLPTYGKAPAVVFAQKRQPQPQQKQQTNNRSSGGGSSQNSINSSNSATCKWVATAACSRSFSDGSFVTVSSSHSTERITSVPDLTTPNISSAPQREWIYSGRAIANGETLKSGSEEVATSSQGASLSRPRNTHSTSDRSGLATTQIGNFLGFSPLILYPNDANDNAEENEVDEREANCVVQLRFDDSLLSLSQLTAASASTVDAAENL